MTNALILLLPSATAGEGGTIDCWWLVRDGVVVGRGDDGRWPEPAPEQKIIALAPPDDAPAYFSHLPGLTAAQAQAVARSQAAERTLGVASAMHIVAAAMPSGEDVVTVALANAAMQFWAALLADLEVKPDCLVPVAALPPPPESGTATRAQIGSAELLRSHQFCAAWDPILGQFQPGTATIVPVTGVEVDAWIGGLADVVPLDLYTGPHALRRDGALSPVQRQWLVRLIAALLLLTLALPLAHGWKRAQTIADADRRALAAAAAAGISGDDVVAAEAEMDRRLGSKGGGPLALSAPLSGLYRSLRVRTAVAMRSIGHSANGTLSVTLASPKIEDINLVLADLQGRGFAVTGQPLSGADGMQMATVTIRAVP